MLTALLLQLASVSILALGAWMLNDAFSAVYVALGGMAAIVPNALFALRLSLHRNRAPESYPVIFFLGEFAKIGLTLGLLYVIVRYAGRTHDDVRWLALLIGLIVALKAPLFALALHKEKPAATDDTRAVRNGTSSQDVALADVNPRIGATAATGIAAGDRSTPAGNVDREGARKVPVRYGPYHPVHARNG